MEEQSIKILNKQHKLLIKKDIQSEQTIKVIKNVFMMLQLFCQDHYRQLQEFLRSQISPNGELKKKQCNLISQSAGYLQQALRVLSNKTQSILKIIIEFIVEALQGPCLENQITFTKTNIVELINEMIQLFKTKQDYISRGFVSQEEQNEINTIIFGSTKILMGLTELNSSLTTKNFMLNQMDFIHIKNIIVQEYKQYVKNKLNLPEDSAIETVMEKLKSQENYSDSIEETFNLYCIFAELAHQYGNKPPNQAQIILDMQSDNKVENNAIKFFKTTCQSIEIINEGIYKVYFPVQPICYNLSEQTRAKMMLYIPRTSENDKIMGMLHWTNQILDEMKHFQELLFYPIKFSANNLSRVATISLQIAFIQNFFMIATMRREIRIVNSNNITFIKDPDIHETLITKALGYFQLVTSIMMFIQYSIIYGPLLIKKAWRAITAKNEQYNKDQKIEDEIAEMGYLNRKYLNSTQSRYLLMTYGPENEFFLEKGVKSFPNLYTKLCYQFLNIMFLFADFEFVYIVFYVFLSFLGSFYNVIFYAFHLLDILNRFDSLTDVIRSITQPSKQLMLTILLAMIVVYMWTLISFYSFSYMYFNPGINNYGESTCITMLHCFLTTMDLGIRQGGGLGDFLELQSYDDKFFYYLRFGIDMAFFLIVNVTFLNIIFGIILDTFSAFASEKQSMESDKLYVCFICGHIREYMDRSGGGFDYHIKNHHYLWNYFYYMYYIMNKDKSNYNGIETYVAEKINNKDPSWFPIQKALCLQENDGESLETVINDVKEIIKSMKGSHEN